VVVKKVYVSDATCLWHNAWNIIIEKNFDLASFFANFFTGFKFHVASFFGLGCDIEACMEAWKRV
jgi:hypothetical protein